MRAALSYCSLVSKFRFGVLVQNNFRPGVAEEDWNSMRTTYVM